MERGLGHGGHMLDLDLIIDRCAARLVAERRGIQLRDSPPPPDTGSSSFVALRI